MKIAVLSDAHGNTPAFLQTIKVAKKHGVSKYFHIGDLIGYIPDLEILDAIQTLNIDITFTRGNHEDAILRNIILQEKDDVLKHQILLNLLTEEQRRLLENFRYHVELEIKSGIAHLSHGGPFSPIDGYIYEKDCLKFVHLNYSHIFVGNTHRPFQKQLGNKWIVNVGSCGFPRDIGSEGSFAILDAFSNEVRLIRHTIPNIENVWPQKRLEKIHKSVLENYYRGITTNR